MSNSSYRTSGVTPGVVAANEDESVHDVVESLAATNSTPPMPGKKMRGAVQADGKPLVGSPWSRLKVSASKPSRTPGMGRKEKTSRDDPNNWAVVTYKPRPFPFNQMETVPQAAARKKFPKPNAVRDQVAGMRIRGSTVVTSPEGKKKRKFVDIPAGGPGTLHPDPMGEMKGVDPVGGRVAQTGSLVASTSKIGEKVRRKGRKRIKNVEEPKYASDDPRARVKEVLKAFDNLRRHFLQEEQRLKSTDKKSREGSHLKAYTVLRDKNYRVNGEDSILGDVRGVQVGDHFYYRTELFLISLHCQMQGGIDYIPPSKSTHRDRNGEKVSVAVSVIASGGYEDDKDEGDVLIYTGQGGNHYKAHKKQVVDQLMLRGNLALKNSCDLGLPVRVIRGNDVKKTAVPSPSGKIYYYDGLYDVSDCYQDRGASGHKVWKYRLVRRPGQGELMSQLVTFKGASKLPLLLERRGEKVLLEDISYGKERLKVPVVSSEDSEDGPLPEPFQYILQNKYPSDIKLDPAKACSCNSECWDKCPCLTWNRGEPPYNENGSIVRGKKAIYECGPHCSCPIECYNRVSQKGQRFDLQVFRTKGKGWGVRSRSFIPQGSFICEYVGEVIHTSEAELRVSTDDYLFDLNLPQSQSKRFGDVSGLVEDSSDAAEGSEEDGTSGKEWTLDAREYGNVARFINHSCSGNLFVQCVFYEHYDMRFPHIMLFAMEKISPYKELTYDYGYVVNSVHANGKQKMKPCLCGASNCKGRLY